jgi:chromosome segregation ATPase
VGKIFAEDDGEKLWKHIAEVEVENSQLKIATAESSETVATLECSLPHSTKDYKQLMAGSKSLLAEHNKLCYHTEDLEAELAKAHADAAEDIAALEAKLKSTVAADDFKRELVKDLKKLRALYALNMQSIGGLCSLMPESEPSVVDYLRWFSTELTSSGADILPTEKDVWRVACSASKNWWRSFGYDYLLVAIQAKFHEVTAHVW